MSELKKVSEFIYEIEKKGEMNVPARIYADDALITKMKEDLTLKQAQNVSCLNGIEGYSFVMPDGHQGYGFPIGGVAAMDYESGIISPGGVGYDINCGVRLLKSNLTHDDVFEQRKEIIDHIFKNVPSGLGSQGKVKLSSKDLDEVLMVGAKWAVEEDYGWKKDLKNIESEGSVEGDPTKVSNNAKKRGAPQLGSLGSGNHFLEMQIIDEIFDEKIASGFGLKEGQICFMMHTGSRGCGHQICSDYIQLMEGAYKKYNIKIPDRELVCAPIHSKEGEDYFKAMGSGANFAWANRQMITHWIRESIGSVIKQDPEDLGLDVLFDVAHNIAKIEKHNGKKYCVHRKGATRAFWKGRGELPKEYEDIGQPVIIPGDMGTASYVMVGIKSSSQTFGSTCHGAGRILSRSAAIKKFRGEDIIKKLEKEKIYVKAASPKVVAEEAPDVYKDIHNVIDVCDKAGLAKKVARLRPMGVAKG
ncbi:MAG: tRNA-splicing ligase RtcB [Candidatus Methanofastidiosum methylothiophilum]|jgi:tRNA-splicing ligase RtcB|uniref:tRNA-splicing ligase RtcB n=1 Tax=Candidatus Methanofastidiosum methylothiophilum TaxID=1705564 RepID=A0A150JEX1_9EURY|nr:MAG: tRNA-splicing ligase RtcB [Candidatus Methanofastidiosum methylthiophilus]MBP6932099.1 RtcB family protein [Methanofastidiosum sp.]OQC50575.1 MAG: tRNA-splicing ligase RtcB [Euryarchaeota archaeon ADurb.Bin023]KYC55777.1 MAG: tRNA-splicing ligase RtcB [Candidatus Methanofastidiosum methylthiophilus]KYC56268.1 MAG: tRNA-splicing ligase RtcB [Candidatus Methanofastidiosum methylthiophilus]